jgi:hypothetical protein
VTTSEEGWPSPEAECAWCHRERELLHMVRVICADERDETDFCDWDCFWHYWQREYGG